MADVFISYAHEDIAFVERLRTALEAREREVWSDHDIEPADRWRTSADEAIDRSDAVLFVVSVASLESEPCRSELAYTEATNKRLIAVCIEEAAADVEDKPAEVAELSWIMLRPVDDFDHGVEQILHALDTDLDAVRQHTRILVRARAWEIGGRRVSPLLRGDELRAAEDWLSEAPARGVQPTDLHVQFIRASRHVATRRARMITAISATVAAVSVALAIVALIERANASHQASIAGSRALAAEAANPTLYGARLSALLSMQAYASSPTVQARSDLVGAVEQPLLATRSLGVGEINGLATTSDGRLGAAAGVHGVAVWRSSDGAPVALIHTLAQVNAVAFSHDGSLIAAALGNGDVSIYRVHGGRRLESFAGAQGSVNAVAFDAVGLSLAYVTESGTVFLRNLATGTSWQARLPSDTLLAVAFSPSGAQLVVGGGASQALAGGVLVTYSVSGAQAAPQRTLGKAAVSSLSFDPRGPLLAAGDQDGNAYVINTQSGATRVLTNRAPVDVVAFAPDGSLLATGDGAGAVRLWNPTSGEQERDTMSAGSNVYGLAFTDGGRTLSSAGLDGTLSNWTGDARPPLERTAARAPALTGGVEGEAIDASGTLIATADRNGDLTIWNGRTLAERRQLVAGGDKVTAVAFEPKGNTLAVGLADGNVVFVDAASGRETKTPALPGVAGHWAAIGLAFGGSGHLAVGYYNGDTSVWSTRGDAWHRLGLLRQAGGVTALAFSPSGRALAIALNVNAIYLYAPADLRRPQRRIKVTESIWSLAFAGGGSELLGGDSAGAVELFNTAHGTSLGSLPASGLPVYGLAVSPDGQTIATTDGGGQLRLWDLASRVELGQPASTGQSTFSVAFAANGRSLVTGDLDGELDAFPALLWSQNAQAFRDYLCPRIGQEPSPAQWSKLVPGESYRPTCGTRGA